MKKIMALLMVTVMLAGCADAIPDAPTDEEGTVITVSGWETMSGNYTVMFGENNSTAPILTVGNSSTWLELQVVILNATHLSFEVVENQIVFSNFTFELEGYLNQSGFLFGSGYAPDLGNATIYTPDFPYDITIEYYCVYREWTGNE